MTGQSAERPPQAGLRGMFANAAAVGAALLTVPASAGTGPVAADGPMAGAPADIAAVVSKTVVIAAARADLSAPPVTSTEPFTLTVGRGQELRGRAASFRIERTSLAGPALPSTDPRRRLDSGSRRLTGFISPLARFVVTSGFGPRFHPVLAANRFHAGVDLAAPIGTPVYAAHDGIVVRANWAGGYGQLIVIQHDDQTETRYGHLAAIGVRAGERVAQGQAIGLVGSTGLATGPHLHYEIRRAGFALRPF